MKKTFKLAATVITSTALLVLTGCKSAPVNPLATQSSPTLAGGMPVLQTFTEKAAITSMIAEQRTIALRTDAGNTITCKAAPQVSNYSQLQVGERVKATISDMVALFPVKSSQVPTAGPGIDVTVAGEPSKVVLQTTDSRGRVTKVDPSYRLLTLEYSNGSTKQFKVPLPNTLENIKKGDEIVVRASQPLAIQIEPR